jgi:hypothetical protein
MPGVLYGLVYLRENKNPFHTKIAKIAKQPESPVLDRITDIQSPSVKINGSKRIGEDRVTAECAETAEVGQN